MLMAKLIKKAVKKPVMKTEPKKEKVEKVVSINCDSCNSTGLQDNDNLCAICHGTGKK